MLLLAVLVASAMPLLVESRAGATAPSNSKTMPAEIDRIVASREGRAVLMSDRIVDDQLVTSLATFISSFGEWRYMGPNSTRHHMAAVGDRSEARLDVSGARFYADLHKRWFARSAMVRALAAGAARIARASSGDIGRGSEPTDWHVLDAMIINVRRGDPVRVSAECPAPNSTATGELHGSWTDPPPPLPSHLQSVTPRAVSSASPGDLVALVFLKIPGRGKQDDYAELTLFEDHPTVGVDSFAGVRARVGRVLILPCQVPYRIAPPAVSTGKAALVLRVVMTLDAARAAASIALAEALRHVRGGSIVEGLGLPEELLSSELVEDVTVLRASEERSDEAAEAAGSVEEQIHSTAGADDSWAAETAAAIDVHAAERRVYETTGGRRVHVFDGLFAGQEHLLSALRQFVLANASFSFDDSTNEDTADDTDNVQWIVGFGESAMVRSRLWPFFRAAADFVTPWPGFYPYDVSINVIRSWDHTLVHADCAASELEYTMLVYLNEDLGPHDGGETVFFDDVGAEGGSGKPSKSGAGGGGGGGYSSGPQSSEVLAVVRPVFGRMAVFNGNVPHSARPPYASYNGVRFTLAVKLSSSRVAAVAKTLSTHVHGSIDELDDRISKQRRAAGAGSSRSYEGEEGDDDHEDEEEEEEEDADMYAGEEEVSKATEAAGGQGPTDWRQMLRVARSLQTRLESLRDRATAVDQVRWSGQRPVQGRPWSSTCLTIGPPPMTQRPEVLAELRGIHLRLLRFGEATERVGWSDVADSLGVEGGVAVTAGGDTEEP